jgi:beta-lactamase regulating signal transducer with metallopeptidase domain
MPAWVDTFGWILVHSVWQIAVLVLLALLIDRIITSFSASARYMSLMAVLIGMVLVPAVTWFVLPLDNATPSHTATLPLQQFRAPPSPAGRDSGSLRSPSPPAARLAKPSARVDGQSAGDSLLSKVVERLSGIWLPMEGRLRPWLGWLAALWLAGASLAILRLLLGWHTVRRLRAVGVSPVPTEIQLQADEVAARLGVKRPPAVLQSTLARMPLALGHRRALILIPQDLITGFQPGDLRRILAHEMAHVRRCDYALNLLQTLIECLLFYHPGMWWASHRVRCVREHCCDELAVAALGSPTDYGRALLALEEHRQPGRRLLAAHWHGGSLRSRIEWLMRDPEPLRTSAAVWATGIAAAACSALIGGWAILSQLPHQRTSPPPAIDRLIDESLTTVTVRSDDNIHFMLAAKGDLQPMLSVEPNLGDSGWNVNGRVTANIPGGRPRAFRIQYSTSTPNRLRIDQIDFTMNALPRADDTQGRGVMLTGRLFLLPPSGDPIHSDRFPTLPTPTDLDSGQVGWLAASVERELYEAHANRKSRQLAELPDWVIAWDDQDAMQHGSGWRTARLRIFPDGRIVGLRDLQADLIEARISRRQVADLVDWLIDQMHASQRNWIQVQAAGGQPLRRVYVDPLPEALWDQTGSRIAVRRKGRIYDLLFIQPPSLDHASSLYDLRTDLHFDQARERLEELVFHPPVAKTKSAIKQSAP